MPSSNTPDQIRRRYEEVFPEGTGALFYSLWNDVAAVHLAWRMFKDLFAHSEERVALVNRTARGFFYNLERLLLRDVFLALARLTDPAKTGRFENASLAQLLEQLKDEIAEAEHADLETRLSKIQERAEPFRTRRNKTLAHADLEVSTHVGDEKMMPGIALEDVDELLDRIALIMNAVAGLVGEGTTLFDDPIEYGGVPALVHALEDHETLEGLRRSGAVDLGNE